MRSGRAGDEHQLLAAGGLQEQLDGALRPSQLEQGTGQVDGRLRRVEALVEALAQLDGLLGRCGQAPGLPRGWPPPSGRRGSIRAHGRCPAGAKPRCRRRAGRRPRPAFRVAATGRPASARGRGRGRPGRSPARGTARAWRACRRRRSARGRARAGEPGGSVDVTGSSSSVSESTIAAASARSARPARGAHHRFRERELGEGRRDQRRLSGCRAAHGALRPLVHLLVAGAPDEVDAELVHEGDRLGRALVGHVLDGGGEAYAHSCQPRRLSTLAQARASLARVSGSSSGTSARASSSASWLSA